MSSTLPADWQGALSAALAAPSFAALGAWLAQERAAAQVFPPADEVYTAFHLTPLSAVRVVVLGQDPYHDDGQAHGLSFSVKPGVKVPPSLKNMYKELASDLGLSAPKVDGKESGDLRPWARAGVLMLNTVLTVRAHEPNSHRDRGWELFTDEVIRAISASRDHVVFVLWGKPAQAKAKLIDPAKHTVLKGAHPSPLSAHAGFFGSRPYSQVNAALVARGQALVDWSLA
ncbi:MAG: uracil-DNA glycosylase [Deltaproteobacteria bacterium]|nr:uracil-DNA glycosylase [Deltaproteobacteria bacterium]